MGRIAGIARHGVKRGPIEAIETVRVTPDGGVDGDCNGHKNRRQVSLIEADDWAAALAEVGADIPWWERRANLLVQGLDLPQTMGARLRIGADVVIEIRTECDPCERMEALHPGLRAALEPDWRGGALGKVIAGGIINIGDEIRIET